MEWLPSPDDQLRGSQYSPQFNIVIFLAFASKKATGKPLAR
jgi:hypothetical protein